MSAVEAAEILLSQMSNQSTPIADPNRLLQDTDVNRLRAVIYRDQVSVSEYCKGFVDDG